MVFFLGVLCGLLMIVILGLAIKIHLMQRSAEEIAVGFAEKLKIDTNTLIDISSRDRYMMALASQINQELRQLNRQRTRYQQGDLELKAAVANISHDLRTPLTAICGYLDLLEQEEKSTAVANYLNIIRGRTVLLRQLTEELFRYCVVLPNQGSLDVEPVNIGSVLESSLASFYVSLTEKGITPEIGMPKEKVVRRLNKGALSRVFSNLLSNAVKYSDGDLEVSLTQDGRVEFINTCRALSGIEVEKLFDRFYTVEAARKSTGLGLSIARALAERMGGSLTAHYVGNRLIMIVEFPEEF